MLKSLLGLLISKFYSKKESALVAEQALPNESDYTTVSLVTGQNGTYTAPEDGYLNICTKTGGNINVWGGCVQASNFANNNGQAKIFIPLRKGKTVWYRVYGEILAAQFYKLVGGGYRTLKRFVKKGVCLCLSLSFNCLQKPSSKARNRGLAYRECRQLLRQSYPQQWTKHGELMLLQKTVMWFFKAEHLSSSCITRLVQALIMGESGVSLEDLYRFGRDALCTITLKARTALQDSPLLHVSLSNLEKGGSLC